MSKPKTFYLAGPMSGLPQFNFPTFHRVAALLREQGYTIISPAEMDSEAVQVAAMASKDGTLDASGKIAGETWGDILAKDVKLIADKIDGIIFLPDWDRSRGALLEATTSIMVNNREFTYLKWEDSDSRPINFSKLAVALTVSSALVKRSKGDL
jgi:hypothetical protein